MRIGIYNKAFVVLFALSVATSSTAQEAPDDLGLKLGEKTRLHLGVGVSAGFDTNPNYTPMSTNMTGDVVLAVRPTLKLKIPGELLALEAGAHINYLEYLGVMNSATASLRQMDGDANLSLELNRGGQFGFAFKDRVTRAVDPGVAALGAKLARLRNDLSTGVEWRPGGGLLTFNLSYDFGIEFYDPSGGPTFLDTLGLYAANNQISDPTAFNNMDHKLKLRTEWRFLPKTGMFLNIYGSYHGYLGSTTNVATYPLGFDIGLMGQLTGKLSGVASLGYSNPMVVQNGQVATATFIGAVGQLELRYALNELNVVTVGLRRVVRPVYMYTFFTDNRVYAQSKHQIMQRLELTTNAAYAMLAFDASTGAQTQTSIAGGGNRLDHLVQGEVQLNYYILEWLSVSLSDQLSFRFTNAGDAGGANYSYWKNLVLLSLTANY